VKDPGEQKRERAQLGTAVTEQGIGFQSYGFSLFEPRKFEAQVIHQLLAFSCADRWSSGVESPSPRQLNDGFEFGHLLIDQLRYVADLVGIDVDPSEIADLLDRRFYPF